MTTTALTYPPALLDEHGATTFLGGVSAKHLFNLRKRGDLPFLQVGRRVMYSRAALEKWIEAREQVGTA